MPSGENTTDQTQFVCPQSGSPTGSRDLASQIRIVLSVEPETMRLQSGENTTDTTELYPWSGSSAGSRSSASHILIVSSFEPETTYMLAIR